VTSTSGSISVFTGDLPQGLFDDLQRADLVGWDVETSGLDWRADKLGTCQLFSVETGTAVVQMDGTIPQRLSHLLVDRRVRKIFHHAPFDLRFLCKAWSVTPASVYCTKIASKLLMPTAENSRHSLQALLASHLGIHVQKGRVRTSDWLSKSLTLEQVRYAAEDVMHLPALHGELTSKLSIRGLEKLYQDCCNFLPTRVALDMGGYPDVFAY
jgi:ribonuclease D